MPDSESLDILRRRLAVARGEAPADVCIKNARVLNVLSGEIHEADVAVADGVVVGFAGGEAATVVEADGRYLCPGFIDGHIHIESTLLSPPVFARAVAPHGTCAVVSDPHEIANVLGLAGIEYMLACSRDVPVTCYFMMPSCVPATDMATSGARIGASDVAAMLARYPDRILGLAEVMNYPGVVGGDEDMLRKLRAARGRVIDGHAPGLAGRALDAYVTAGPGSDHECTELEEAREKLRRGLHVMIRQGSTEQNLDTLLPLVTADNSTQFSLVSDDRDPVDLSREGHINALVRQAVSRGVPPLRAVAMASINPARYFGLRRRGAIAPGYRADFMLVTDLTTFDITDVFLNGRHLADWEFADHSCLTPPRAMRVGGELTEAGFAIPASGPRHRVIGLIPGQIVTEARIVEARIANGLAVADPERDIAKLAVIERHKATGNMGLGFVSGLGLKRGAVAGTVAHDAHNLIVAGVNDADMVLAARTLMVSGGGFAVVADGKVLGQVRLPVAGLMSDAPLEVVTAQLAALGQAYRQVAGAGPEALAHPFMAMSFLSLEVIPSLKLTDQGLFDVTTFSRVGLFA
ncbi:MAG: adenine deaminase [Solidesulfovibrio sp.]|uniref:adenine deaminase n=1 Tax=Solidesulfovibrio sp. TaxID=2910990 RepID=UPI002B200710|nr:adenine deaminase [Solidesulfovibrio sp.]MEA4857865.1 adenine deaminase [Solidesulfovibrio sp.]